MNPGFGNRRKLAELTNTVGAGVLGVGVGAWLSTRIDQFLGVIIVVGLALHVWGMLDKHRLEKQEGALIPIWASTLYWICWLLLLGLVLWLVFQISNT